MKELDYIVSEFTKRMTMLSEATARGQCSSYDEYKYTCGQLRGLEAACAIVEDLKQRMENSDDE
jgi:hypothetical protein